MFSISKTTKVVSNKEGRGVFEIEALYPGYGATIGNSLRRVLLSSLEGAAVTQAKIKGAPHEFSTISGIKEDVIGILLNLKQMRFKAYGEGPFIATIKVKGVKEVKAGDVKTSSDLEIINKDLVIAHLTDKSSELDIEIEIGRGVGYEASEARNRGKEEIGVIALDASYTPVQKVSYRVEQMRVGDRTDYDRLVMEIETDGTLNPEAALKAASDILVRQFEVVGESLQSQEEVGIKAPKKTAAKKATKKITVKK